MKKAINVQGFEINLIKKNEKDYISLTDIAKKKNPDFPADVIKNWLRTKSTIEFLGTWEKINNPDFKLVEFDQFKNMAGSNTFVLTPQKWIKETNAIGIISKSGRYGGTFAHVDIALEFASWVSAEFKLYIITEFKRLKQEESEKKTLGWDVKRTIAKINYKIHTDAIKDILIKDVKEFDKKYIYADEADLLNLVVFGKTAKEWRELNPDLAKQGNIRDFANVIELVIISNLEVVNAELIRQGFNKYERYKKLKEIAIRQFKSLNNLDNFKKLGN